MGENRLTRIVTRTGDTGSTGLADGSRLPKTHPRIAAMGDVDELNAAIGLLCVAPGVDESLVVRLRRIQNDLFDLGGELSLPGSTLLDRQAIAALESDVAQWNAALPPLTEFVLPGANEASARAHLARTVCRRAERTLWQLAETPDAALDTATARYLNRLSDALFVLARMLVRSNGDAEVVWQKPS
ncbi:MAG: cob(I)yrinic acid a,c-diamide adenosyltransferase [Pseudomonadota bacterium]